MIDVCVVEISDSMSEYEDFKVKGVYLTPEGAKAAAEASAKPHQIQWGAATASRVTGSAPGWEYRISVWTAQ